MIPYTSLAHLHLILNSVSNDIQEEILDMPNGDTRDLSIMTENDAEEVITCLGEYWAEDQSLQGELVQSLFDQNLMPRHD